MISQLIQHVYIVLLKSFIIFHTVLQKFNSIMRSSNELYRYHLEHIEIIYEYYKDIKYNNQNVIESLRNIIKFF